MVEVGRHLTKAVHNFHEVFVEHDVLIALVEVPRSISHCHFAASLDLNILGYSGNFMAIQADSFS